MGAACGEVWLCYLDITLLEFFSSAQEISVAFRANTDVVGDISHVACELIVIAGHEHTIGVFGDTEPLLSARLVKFVAHVMSLRLSGKLPVVEALLILCWVRFYQFVDDNVSLEIALGRTELSHDLSSFFIRQGRLREDTGLFVEVKLVVGLGAKSVILSFTPSLEKFFCLSQVRRAVSFLLKFI